MMKEECSPGTDLVFSIEPGGGWVYLPESEICVRMKSPQAHGFHVTLKKHKGCDDYKFAGACHRSFDELQVQGLHQ